MLGAAPTLALLLASSTPSDVVVWHAYRAAEKAAIERAVEEFHAQQEGIRVRLLSVPYDAFASKLTAAIPRGNGPDLFIFAHERVGSWAQGGLLETWSPPAEGEFLQPTLDALEYDGALYGLPLAYKSLALFYNRALVATPPKTTDELIAVAAKLTKDDRYGLAYPVDDFYFHAPWVFGFGGELFTEDGRPRLDHPGTVASLDFVKTLLIDERVVPQETTNALARRLFNEGRAAMMINGPWALGEIDAGIDFGIAVLPTVSATNRAAAPFLTVEALMRPIRSKNPGAALELAHFLVSRDAALIRAIHGRQSVATASVYGDPRIRDDPVMAAFRAQLERATPMSNRPEMKMIWEPAKGALKQVARGGDSGAAVERAQSRLSAVSRPAPEESSPLPFLLAVGLLGLLGGAWMFTRAREPQPLEVGVAFWQRNRIAYSFLAPAFFGLLFLVLMPFAVGVAIGFTHFEGGQFQHFVGFANFADILLGQSYGFTDPLSFYFTMGVTLMWTVVNVVLHLGFGVALALLLKEPWLKMRGVFRVLLIVPWAVPNYITALIWKGMFHKQYGAINGLLTSLGLEPVSWFSSFWTAFTANVVTNTWLGFPFMMVVTLGALQSIPQHLYEAADIDGVSRWQKFRFITLPLLKTALLPAVTVGMIWTFNMFNVIYLVSGGEPDGATDILISEAYRWAFQRREQYGYAAAYATLIFCILVAYTFFTRRISGEKELA